MLILVFNLKLLKKYTQAYCGVLLWDAEEFTHIHYNGLTLNIFISKKKSTAFSKGQNLNIKYTSTFLAMWLLLVMQGVSSIYLKYKSWSCPYTRHKIA